MPGADFRAGLYIGQLDSKEKLRRGLGVRVYFDHPEMITTEQEFAETSLSVDRQLLNIDETELWPESSQKCVQLYEGEWRHN